MSRNGSSLGRVSWVSLSLVALLVSAAGALAGKGGDGKRSASSEEAMKAYTERISGTDLAIEMVPVPSGTFTMGSPPDGKYHEKDEGPQFKVEMHAFWIGKYEVTWADYKAFMNAYHQLREQQGANQKIPKDRRADVVSFPTPLYDPSHTYEFGEAPKDPAVSMTQFAARQFTKWLSKQTGSFYRLPTEAEWEYACRAGTSTRFYFGDDKAKLKKHAWYFKNAFMPIGYRAVGKKKPNPWGLYDVHGNVAEWVIDQYDADHYEQFKGKTVNWRKTINWPDKMYPRVVRGGSWDSDAKDCRCAARAKSDSEWKLQDPQIPKSVWWHTDARTVGFRVLRPLHPPDKKMKNRFWNADIEKVRRILKTDSKQIRSLLDS